MHWSNFKDWDVATRHAHESNHKPSEAKQELEISLTTEERSAKNFNADKGSCVTTWVLSV